MHLKRQLARLGVVNDGGPQNGWAVLVYIVTELIAVHSGSLSHATLGSLQVGHGRRGVLHGERAGLALSGAAGLKHAWDLGAEEVMTDISSWPIRPFCHACHHSDLLHPEQEVISAGYRKQEVGRLRTKGLVYLYLCDSGVIQRRLALRPPLSPLRTSTFSGHFYHGDQTMTSLWGWPILWRLGIVGSLFIILKRRCVRSASFSTATTVQLSIIVQFCLLFNRCQMKGWMVIYLNCFVLIHLICFFPPSFQVMNADRRTLVVGF